MFNLFKKYFHIIKYLISGTTGAAVNLVALYIFTDILKIWYLTSSVIAFILSFFVGFYLQKLWTFNDGDKAGTYRQMTGYLLVALLNLVLNTFLLYLFVDGLKIWYLLAQFIITGLIAIESYFIYKLFIFNKKIVGRNVLIATGIYPPDYRGPATLLEALPKALEENGFKIKIITYSSAPAIASEKNKVYRISRSGHVAWRYLKYFLRMLMLAGWADVIYATDIYSVGYFSFLIKKLTGRKYLIRFAGDSAWETSVRSGWISDDIENFQKKIYDEKIEKLKSRRKKIMKNADAVIAVSNFLAGIAEAIGVSKEKIKVIYNSIDFIKADYNQNKISEIRKPYGSEAKIIVSAGELNPWKGFDGLIKAMPRLISDLGENVHLLILGDGQELGNLKNLARELKVEKNIHLLGKIDHSEIMNYFKAADLFVLNTNYEGLSHTLLEVMKANVPIISTNISPNQEVIINNQEGILVGYNKVDELAGAILKVIKDPELAESFVKNASEKLHRFSWNSAVADTVELINKTI